jgi:hypothetical protein
LYLRVAVAEVGSYSQQEWGDIVISLQQGEILLRSFIIPAHIDTHGAITQIDDLVSGVQTLVYTIIIFPGTNKLTFLPGLVHLLFSISSQAS